MSALSVAKVKLVLANLLDAYSKSTLSAKNKFSSRQALFGTSLVVFGAVVTIYKKIQFNKVKKDREIETTTKITPASKQNNKVRVGKLFFQRLGDILKIIVPSWKSAEALHLFILTILLYSRTILSIKVADITGKNAQYIVQKNLKDIFLGIVQFALIGVPASLVNSGLRYATDSLSLLFRKRLTDHVNNEYLKGTNFYKASNLGGESRIDNADQRVTRDIERFSESLSSLYATIFKPLLDVILFTYKLALVLGPQGPALIFTYYFFNALVKRFLMPAFGKLTARESELEGDYRMAHQRLITNSEEIAFYDGSKREKEIISRLFMGVYHHANYFNHLKFLVGIFDEFLVKYGASIIGYVILALPIIQGRTGSKTTADLTGDFVRNRQLLISLAKAIGQLIVLFNKVTMLAGLTARVAELLEMVKTLEGAGNAPFELRDDDTRQKLAQPAPEQQPVDVYKQDAQMDEWLAKFSERKRVQRTRVNTTLPSEAELQQLVLTSGKRGVLLEGELIKFMNVSIVSPEGKLLASDMSFEVKRGQNVIITGPNGAGKSSLFRILGELWPLHCGVVVKPRKEDVLFVPQKPYLVLGSLRDQVIYPHKEVDMKAAGVTDSDLERLMDVVDPSRTILNQWKWTEVKDWLNTFSGGQKQRVAMARVFYHRPLYAVLDECTSAVSLEVEGKIYETCSKLGITLFTVSHKPYLRQYHDYELNLDGRGGWSWTKIDKEAK
jgi:ATP-binding cassette subfamily D (ALD) protein 3